VYRFFPEEGVVAYKVVGRTGPTDMKELFDEIGAEEAFSHKLMGVADLREVDFSVEVREVIKLARYVKDEKRENCPWITLVSGPIATAFSILFGKYVERYQVYVFSTEEKASSQLGRDVRPFLDAISEVPELPKGQRRI